MDELAPSNMWQEFLSAKLSVMVSQYALVAAATVFTYDILLTLGDEIELVWKRDLWTFPTLLYFGNRYVSLASILFMAYSLSPFHPPFSQTFCKQGVSIVGFVVGVASWGGIMVLRVAALWKTNMRIFWFLWATLVVMVFTMGAGAAVVYFSMLPTLAYNSILGTCTSISGSHIQTILPGVQAAFVWLVTAFTVMKAYQYPSPLRTLKDMSSVMSLLLRDGVIYFIVVSILSLVSGISWLLIPRDTSPNLIYVFVYLNWSIFSTIVARLFLRLRKMFYSPSTHAQTICSTTIRWAPPARRHDSASLFTTIPWSASGYTLPSALAQLQEYTETRVQDAPSRFFQDDEFAVLSIHNTAMRTHEDLDEDWYYVQSPADVFLGPLSPVASSSCRPCTMERGIQEREDTCRTRDAVAKPTSKTSSDRPKTAPSAFTSSSTLVEQRISEERVETLRTSRPRPSTAGSPCTKRMQSTSREKRSAWIPLIAPKKAATRSRSNDIVGPSFDIPSSRVSGCSTTRRDAFEDRRIGTSSPSTSLCMDMETRRDVGVLEAVGAPAPTLSVPKRASTWTAPGRIPSTKDRKAKAVQASILVEVYRDSD